MFCHLMDNIVCLDLSNHRILQVNVAYRNGCPLVHYRSARLRALHLSSPCCGRRSKSSYASPAARPSEIEYSNEDGRDPNRHHNTYTQTSREAVFDIMSGDTYLSTCNVFLLSSALYISIISMTATTSWVKSASDLDSSPSRLNCRAEP